VRHAKVHGNVANVNLGSALAEIRDRVMQGHVEWKIVLIVEVRNALNVTMGLSYEILTTMASGENAKHRHQRPHVEWRTVLNAMPEATSARRARTGSLQTERENSATLYP